MIKCTAVHSYGQGRGRPAEAETSVSGPGNVECPEQMQIYNLFWLQDCVWKGWTSATRSQYLSILFPIPKKKGPARYQIPCSCHSRPAAEVPEGDPEAEAGPPEEKPGPHQDFVAKNILLPQIIVDAEARQILGGASGAKSSPGVRLLADPDLGGVEKFGNAASSALSTLADYKPAIGTGGSAIVYRGDYSGGEVAVKIPRPEYRVVVCSGRI